MDRFFILLPLFIFLGATWADDIGIKIGVPTGTFTTIAEVALSVWTFILLKRHLVGKYRYLLLVPLGIGLGDLAYGLNHYIFKRVYVDTIGPLTYAIPYVMGMAVGIYYLFVLAKKTKKSNSVLVLANLSAVLVFALNIVTIIVPSLLHKSPSLPPIIAGLTVIFSILESWIVGLSAVLLIVASDALVQILLFGLLVMNLSDIALRYQSVYMNLVGMTIFENGWFLGLSFLVVGIIATLRKTESEIKAQFHEFLNFYSIRAMTVGFILFGLCLVWFLLSYYFKSLHMPDQVSATLLIALGVFAFAICVANIVSHSLSRVTFKLSSNRPILRQDFSKHLPEEINTIVEYFQKLNSKISAERDHALGLSSKMAHNIKSPVGALKMAKFAITQHINTGCTCCQNLQDQVKLLEVSSESINSIATDLLEEKRRLIGLETVASSLKKAATLAKANHPTRKIKLGVSPHAEITPVSGLTEVVSNLINNAVDASTPEQDIFIKADLMGSDMIVSVKDAGKGIPENVLKQLRAGKSFTTKILGNGIGVSSTYGWAKDRGYEVTVDSSTKGSNKGTSVSIHIPASPWIEETLPTPKNGNTLWT